MSGVTTGEGGAKPTPTAAELDEMSPEELARLATELDDVVVQHNAPKFPIPGTRAEKRAERAVAFWFGLSAIAALAFVVAFIAWPHEYRPPSDPGYTMYSLYTPAVGITFGLAVLSLGVGVITYVRKFFPEEVSVQQRHDGRSDEVARRTVMAQLASAGKDTTIARRSLIKRSAGAAAGLFGIGLGIAAIGPLIRNPWKDGPDSPLWVTGWKSTNGETVYLRADTGELDDIRRVRPEDMEPGSMQTVFPFRESERGNEEALLHAQKASDAPVMLIRLRPGTKVVKRAGQENFNYGDYYAFSKICTHLGCPTSLYQAQDNRILCPCHQSQFLATEYARPVFGPATRALPQLPITVDEQGYFVALSDFHEAVGPAFWERRS
ncbi:MAG: ubiquinol-cytochrome c reductase iron-sulfur subunit [Pseudonocardia sp.]|uniref:cytochrome bc1 complex Rieske iron-sulfur subunit n=1 Tax=unclassified Pseudonocardia TaxID=2619320 RepID=UPI00086F2A80|nr:MULTISPECIES: ubiquinol-cytochrome c reductase iron-sulfur subunit [unclassified Pseudonocardia]MBN9107729.1 ubiquinol-cytochrome c reductase iron-sulfur subunit [Pseudonocardia sp.]ODV01246.1 MAG: menaquinol-cytochrome C reductase [Pseudonocardia sp. SCN 73-27]